jgi:phosphoglycerate dehydrogenase-like enzyme
LFQIRDLRSGIEARLDDLLEPFERVAKEGAPWAQHFPCAGHSELDAVHSWTSGQQTRARVRSLMKTLKIAILDDYANAALTLADWSPVTQQAEVHVFTRHLSDDEIVQTLEPFHILCTLRERTSLPAQVLNRLPNLKAIVVTDTNVRTIDYSAAAKNGVVILEGKAPTDLPSAPASTAEFAWGLILATVRHIPAEVQRLREGSWQKSLGVPLEGKTLGIVGLGKIGARIARYARAFDMHVLAWSQNLTEEAAGKVGAERVGKDELFRRSDIVTVHYVMSERSRGLVGKAELAAMKPTAYLINTSRGPLVDEAALIETLQSKRIAGAGLDVFDQEPLPKGHPLLALDNVTATPHLGFVTEPSMRRFHSGAALAVASYLRGEPGLL